MSATEAEQGKRADENPFAPPATGEKAFVSGEGDSRTDYELDRRKHLGRETSIKAVGSLMIFASAVMGITSFYLLTVPVFRQMKNMGDADVTADFMYGMAAINLVMVVVPVWGGFRLRRLKPSGRILCTIVMGFGILSFNLIIVPLSAAFLYLLWSPPSNRIFRRDYREAVLPATTHIQYKINRTVRVLFALCLLWFVGDCLYRLLMLSTL